MWFLAGILVSPSHSVEDTVHVQGGSFIPPHLNLSGNTLPEVCLLGGPRCSLVDKINPYRGRLRAQRKSYQAVRNDVL